MRLKEHRELGAVCTFCKDRGVVLVEGPYPGRVSPRYTACPVCQDNSGYPFNSKYWVEHLPELIATYQKRRSGHGDAQ